MEARWCIMAKMGRPTTDVPKDKRLGFRLSAEEYQKLLEYAAEHNLTITETLQKSLKLLYQTE